MIRTGIATSESVAELLENAGTPLSYGATAESWREALTTISGADETITPRETEGVTGWSSDNDTIVKTFNKEELAQDKFTVDIIFLYNGEPVEVENALLNGVTGIKENDHYEFAGFDTALEDVNLTFTFNSNDYTVVKSYSSFTDDVVIITDEI